MRVRVGWLCGCGFARLCVCVYVCVGPVCGYLLLVERLTVCVCVCMRLVVCVVVCVSVCVIGCPRVCVLCLEVHLSVKSCVCA